ncbi:MAG: hypothetical protein LQ351_000975 [Letrouitia transgressa]|nr:MAG: hypothetical protein LQ351_000975 [Letrouitia transgressa]
MRIWKASSVLLAVFSAVSSVSVPRRRDILSLRDNVRVDLVDAPLAKRFEEALLSSLEKRRGGGGSGGGGGGGGGGRGGSSSSSSSSGSSGSRGSSGGGSGSGSGSRNTGTASFRNATNTTQAGQNETLPVTCLCQQYNACGCDDNDDRSYLDSIIGNGSIAAMNSSLVHVGPVNGTKTIVLNGTLPNGTDTSSNTSTAARRLWLEASGIWMIIVEREAPEPNQKRKGFAEDIKMDG